MAGGRAGASELAHSPKTPLQQHKRRPAHTYASPSNRGRCGRWDALDNAAGLTSWTACATRAQRVTPQPQPRDDDDASARSVDGPECGRCGRAQWTSWSERCAPCAAQLRAWRALERRHALRTATPCLCDERAAPDAPPPSQRPACAAPAASWLLIAGLPKAGPRIKPCGEAATNGPPKPLTKKKPPSRSRGAVNRGLCGSAMVKAVRCKRAARRRACRAGCPFGTCPSAGGTARIRELLQAWRYRLHRAGWRLALEA